MTEDRARQRPNILLIMADQFRADAISAARLAGGESDPTLQTPNLDRLCAEGVRFARAYTESPVCVSARATTLTGLLPHRNKVFDNGYRLDPRFPTLPALLRERGYHCQAIGKMHFSPVREHHGMHRLWLSEEIPRSPEDDEFLQDLLASGFGHVEEPHGARHEMYYIPQVSPLPEALHTTAWTGNKTVQYLHERAALAGSDTGAAPFFCWTSFIKPHPPFDPPVPWHTLYRPTDLPLGTPIRTDGEPDRHTYYHRTQNRFKWTDFQPEANLLRIMRAYYAACVSFVDQWVGAILDTLETLGLRENTLVLFVADHGEYLGDHYAFGKRGYHDPPSRIPFILSWPGSAPQGEVRHDLTGLADVLPTCLAAAGDSSEDGSHSALDTDGQDLLAIARGERQSRELLFGQLAEGQKALYAAMDADWKYIFSAPDNREYLLYRGPGEGPSCDLNECEDHAQSPNARPALERLRGALIERFRRDGYEDALDPSSQDGLRHFAPLAVPWEPLDEMEMRSTVARGWQYAAWNRREPFDTPAHDLRLAPEKQRFVFPSLTVEYRKRGSAPDSAAGTASSGHKPRSEH